MEKMIKTQNLDMILGIQNDLNKAKYNALNSLKGSFVAEITNDDGSVVKLQAILNGATDPELRIQDERQGHQRPHEKRDEPGQPVHVRRDENRRRHGLRDGHAAAVQLGPDPARPLDA